MAITRAQQAKQMLQDGGMLVKPSTDGKRPGYRSARAQEVQGRTGYSSTTGKQGPTDNRVDDRSSDRQTAVTKAATDRLGRQDANQMDSTIFYGPKGETIDIGYQGPLNKREQELKNFLDRRNKVNLFGLSKIFTGPAQSFSNFSASINRPFFEKVIRAGKIPGLNFDMTEEEYEEAYQNYLSERLAGNIDAYGNPLNTGDDGPDQPIIPMITPGDGDGDDDDSEDDDDTNTGGLALRFRKDGGRINAMDGGMMSPVGGIMDLESGRQMYFLGKLVKKATRTVKKIAKSPLGKIALGAAAFKFGAPFLKSQGLPSFFSKKGLSDFFFAGKDMAFKNLTGKGAMAGIGALSALPFLFKGDEEEEDQTVDRGPGLDIDFIRNNPYNFLGRRFVADGGIMRTGYQEGSKEPVAKKTMPLLDMDGQEKDYRETGGFVDMGRMERADDVPARLSKNEFVFTADAVRNAGEGDIDKGAEVMYNMMKNLESGGEVSEESQGLEGAREMFQTSKRLEEVL